MDGALLMWIFVTAVISRRPVYQSMNILHQHCTKIFFASHWQLTHMNEDVTMFSDEREINSVAMTIINFLVSEDIGVWEGEIGLRFLVAAILVESKECPYANPHVRSMTCIKDLPSIKFRPVDIQKYQNTDSTENIRRVHQRHEKRGSLDETEVIMTPAVDFPPPSTPEMTLDFLNYFCSNAGAEIVRCTSELDEKCSEHPSMREAIFNPGQALKAQSLCSQYVTYDFRKTLHCINITMATERVARCLYIAYSRNKYTDRLITSHTRMCSALAEAYNCFVQNIGSRCGSENLSFIISVMRSMEPRYCNNIVDAIYSDPLQWTSSSTSYKMSSFIILLTLILGLDATLL